MKSIISLIVALFTLFQASTAFTVNPIVQQPSRVMTPTNQIVDQAPLTTRAMFIDPNIPEIANAPAIGSIIMLVLTVSFWEFATPGRARK